METTDILSLISLCFTIFFAVPPFIEMIVRYSKTKLMFNITGTEIDKLDNNYVISLQAINLSDTPHSITNMLVNNQKVLIIEDNKLKSPTEIYLESHDNKILRIVCPEIKETEKIEIVIYSTGRKRPFRKKINSLIELFNKK